ncbi:MAG: hypothetical protein KGZ38_04330 [Erysipelothrix sp.]|nr:hypothetical protein [Erysipelothrix sp.]
MKKVITLALKLTKTSFVLIDDKKKASGKKQLAFFVLLIVLLIPNFASFGYMTYDMTSFLATINQDQVILALLLQIGVSIIIFSSIFMVPSYLFYAKDIEKLLPLPLTKAQLYCAKLIQIHIYQMGFFILIILPFVVGYTLAVGFSTSLLLLGFFLWMNAIVTMIATSIVLVLIMSVSPWFKNKDAVTLILSMISLGFALYINYSIGGLDLSDPQAIAYSLIQGQQSLAQGFSSFLPHLSASVAMIVDFNWITFVAYVVLTTVFIIGSIVAFAPILVNIMASFSGSSSTKKMTLKSLRSHQIKPAIIALSMKELKLLFRTPVYFFNNILVMLILPIIFGFSFIQGAGGNMIEFEALSTFIASQPIMLVVVSAGLSALFSTINLVTPTSISREGSSKYHMLLYPVEMSTQLYAKFISGILVSLIAILPLTILFIILNIQYIKLDLIWIVGSLISMLIVMIFMNLFGLLVDVYHPKLVWENEQAAVKQNINFLFTFLGSAAIIALMVFTLFNLNEIAHWIILGIHGALLIASVLFKRIIETRSLDVLIEH